MRQALPAIAVVLVVVLATAGGAVAAWSTSGAGTASASGGAVASITSTWASVDDADGSIEVTWAAVGHADGYRVRRVAAAGGGPLPPGPACDGATTSTSCTETAPPEGRWRYTVTPRFGPWTGWTGAASNEVAVAPTAPTLLAVAPVDTTTAELTIVDRSTSETDWQVQRRQGAGPFLAVGTLPSTTGPATGEDVVLDGGAGLACDSTVEYRVLAASAEFGLESLPSAAVSVTMPPCQPSLHVAEIVDGGSVRRGQSANWVPYASITVHDADDTPAEGVLVTATFSWGTTEPVPASCTTGPAGSCTLALGNGNANATPVTVTVTDLTGDDSVHDRGRDVGNPTEIARP